MKILQPVILCGGGGSRLYPISNSKLPKQFISLGDKGTLLEQTLYRVKLISDLCHNVNTPLLIMNEAHKIHLNNINNYQYDIIYEKYSNDTAVAVANVVNYLMNKYQNNDMIMVVFPADHYIYEVDHFVRDIVNGIKKVTEDNIVLFGLEPTHPTPKYGYILNTDTGIKFTEKPSVAVASELIAKNALWNSGIFSANVKLIWNYLSNTRYHIMDYVVNPHEGKAPSFDVVMLQEYDNIIAQVCHGWKWSDVGTWDTFLEIPEIKQELNTQNIITSECTNTQVLNRGNGNTVIIGCKDILVVRNGNDVLIMANTKDYSNQLKDIATKL